MGKPAQRSEQEPGGGWDGASMASAGGGGSQMVEGAKRRGATDLLGGAEAGPSPRSEGTKTAGQDKPRRPTRANRQQAVESCERLPDFEHCG